MNDGLLEKAILDNLSIGIVVLDKKGEVLNLNTEARQLLGINHELVKTYFEEILNDKFIFENGISVKFFDEILKQIETDGESISRYRASNNKYISVKYRKVEFKGEEFSYIVSEIKDITKYVNRRKELTDRIEKYSNLVIELKARNKVVKELKNRERFYKNQLKTIIDNIDNGIVLVDNNSEVIFLNEKLRDMFEVKNLKNISKLYDKFIFSNTKGETICIRTFIEEYIKRYIEVKNMVFIKESRLTGEKKYLEINTTPVLDKEVDVFYTIVLLKDITFLKKHEKEIEEKNNFIKGVINNLDVPIGVIDYPSLYVKLGNKAFEEIMTLTKRDINNKILDNYLLDGNDDKTREGMKNIINYCINEKKELKNLEYRFKNKNGEERVHKVTYKPLINSENEIVNIQVCGFDITEELNHLDELEKINMIKDEFYTFTSHELRAPLNIICSSIQLILSIYKDEISENIEKILNKMYQNCSRLLKITNNILDLSKAESGFLEVRNSNFDIINITEDIMQASVDYAKSKGIELIFNTDVEEFTVFLDKDKYEKVILNLLSNAIKFTPSGKSIFVSVFINEEEIIISVKDEGIGIPENKINVIFDKFAQVNNMLQKSSEGTGLGLALVKKFIDMMNGKIVLISEEGKGSEFNIIFNKNLIISNGYNDEDKCFESVKDKVRLEFSDI